MLVQNSVGIAVGNLFYSMSCKGLVNRKMPCYIIGFVIWSEIFSYKDSNKSPGN